MSGLPNARSITSSPDRRSSIFSASTWANAYGGSALMRRNSITERLLTPSRSKTAFHTFPPLRRSHRVGDRPFPDVYRDPVQDGRQVCLDVAADRVGECAGQEHDREWRVVVGIDNRGAEVGERLGLFVLPPHERLD